LSIAGCLCLAGLAQTASEQDFRSSLQQGFDLHREARFSEAIPVLRRAWNIHPDDYFANLLLGIDLLRTGKPGQAVPRLERAAKTRPAEEIPEDYLGEAEAGLSHYARAAEAYQQGVQRGHDSEQSLEAWAGFALERFRQIGESLRASNAGVATIRRLQQAAARPADTLACRESVVDLERALGETKSRPSAMSMDTAYQLSICYAVAAGRAEAQLQSKAEDQAALDRVRGDVLLRLKGDAKGAQSEYRKAVALRPRDPALMERMAEAESMGGNNDAAHQWALAALAIDPHQREALRTLVSLTMSNREYDQALTWLRQLVVEAPGDPTVQVELGTALVQTGRPAEALQHLTPALAAGYPDEKGALHALEVRAFRQLGRDREADRAAAEARRLSDAFQNHHQDGEIHGPGSD
jgi:predicted Zn-dependent protease